MKDGPRIRNMVHKIWKLHVPPRMKVFGWLMSLNKTSYNRQFKQAGLADRQQMRA